jgi:hypothetical protein
MTGVGGWGRNWGTAEVQESTEAGDHRDGPGWKGTDDRTNESRRWKVVYQEDKSEEGKASQARK